jgi:hypothetical protein
MLLPDNAATELKRAYNAVVEAGVTHLWDHAVNAPVSAQRVTELYRRAMDEYRRNTPTSRLCAERWARAAKHLAEAIWHEAKISYLKDRTSELPYLTDAVSEYHLHQETEEGARSLLNTFDSSFSQSHQALEEPDGALSPDELRSCLVRGQSHLKDLNDLSQPRHELLRAERIKAANQYGRALECVLLALESQAVPREEKKAA